MRNYNEHLIKKHGSLSLWALEALLLYPNIYEADSLADFLDNKDSIEPTPKWRVLPPARKARGTALVHIPECRYRLRVKTIDYRAVAEHYKGKLEDEKRRFAEEIESLEPGADIDEAYRQSIEEAFRLTRECFDKQQNAEIYDGEHSFSLVSVFQLPNEGCLDHCTISYDGKWDYAQLLSYKTQFGHKSRRREHERRVIGEMLRVLRPQPLGI
jgi:hypothetical protein